MITNFLLDNRLLATILAVVGLIAGVLIGLLVVRRPEVGRRIAASITILALAAIIGLTLTPTGRTGVGGCAVQFNWPSLTQVDTTANLLLFIPLALFGALWTKHPWLTLAACAGVSLLIEGLQAMVGALGRSCDTGDLANNLYGALLGTGIAALLLRQAARTSKTETHAGL